MLLLLSVVVTIAASAAIFVCLFVCLFFVAVVVVLVVLVQLISNKQIVVFYEGDSKSKYKIILKSPV